MTSYMASKTNFSPNVQHIECTAAVRSGDAILIRRKHFSLSINVFLLDKITQ